MFNYLFKWFKLFSILKNILFLSNNKINYIHLQIKNEVWGNESKFIISDRCLFNYQYQQFI